MQVNGQGFGHSAIGSVNIVSIPSGVHLTRTELAQLQEPTPHVIDHEPQQETPALEPIEAPVQTIEARTPEEARLISELEALPIEELQHRAEELARQLGIPLAVSS